MVQHTIFTLDEVTAALLWTILPVLLSSLLFPLPGTAVVIAVHFAAMLLLPLVKPEIHFAYLGAALPFLLILGGAILLVQRQRELLEQDRQAELRAGREEVDQSIDDTLRGWARALEFREQEVAGHSWRVVDLTLDLARWMGVGESEIPNLRRGALLHDIGKMGIPDKILLKPGSLSEEEWQAMRLHPVYAARFLDGIPYLKPAMAIPSYHHERWDGSGYPDGLAGEAIPLPARIFAVVDSWDSLLSDRPYRDAWPREHALRYIKDKAGTHFDPKVVEVFLKMVT
jgi:putative nucleotidyltransferase with HDIG domain